MTKRNILRITGSLFSLLIIASVFLPYNKVNNMPLFSFSNTGELILSIVIILFGIVSVVLYLLNYYCEFPLSTSGAVLFFVIIEAVYGISNKTMSEFGIGYYLLVLGSILLFINTILIMFTKNKKKEEVAVTAETTTITDNIDKLYSEPINEQPIQELQYNNQMNNTIQELPTEQVVQPIQSVESIQPVQPVEPLQPIVEPIQSVQPVEQLQPIQELKPIEETQVASQPTVMPEIQFEQMPEYKEPIKPMYEEPKEVSIEDNPALKSLLEDTTVAPVQSSIPQQSANPVVNEFAAPQQPVNPVLQQFDQPMSFIGQPIQQEKEQQPQQAEGIGMNIFNNH